MTVIFFRYIIMCCTNDVYVQLNVVDKRLPFSYIVFQDNNFFFLTPRSILIDVNGYIGVFNKQFGVHTSILF